MSIDFAAIRVGQLNFFFNADFFAATLNFLFIFPPAVYLDNHIVKNHAKAKNNALC